MSASPHAVIARLSDAEILEIFDQIVSGRGREGENRFLRFYGAALQSASRRDFLILRAVSLILIAKYQLQPQKS
jgi:hypothetical protein